MEKDFDSWNKKKKQINEIIVEQDFFYQERELWWCTLGINVGVEADGKQELFERPILIVKKFNKDQFWGLPLGSVKQNSSFYHEIHHGKETSWINLSQLKVLSSKRLLRKIWRISIDDFKLIQEKLKSFL